MTATISPVRMYCLLAIVLALTVTHPPIKAQNSEWFVEIYANDASFEVVSPIETVEKVWQITPAFSDELGQYTFIQAEPEMALITMDIDNGDVMHYAPLSNYAVVRSLVRVSEDRILGIEGLNSNSGMALYEMNPVTGGDMVHLLSLPNSNWGTLWGALPFAFDVEQNRFIVQYATDTNQAQSKLLVYDVGTGTVISDGIVDFCAYQLYYHSGEQKVLGVFQEAGPVTTAHRFVGWVDFDTGTALPITNPVTVLGISTGLYSGSLDESGERILYTHYSTYGGSTLTHLNFSNNTLERETFLILESDNDPDDIIFFDDSSRNVLNGYYSNTRNKMYAIHWGRSEVGVLSPDLDVAWRLHTESQKGLYRISGLRSDMPKVVEVHDAGGRPIVRREERGGESLRVQLTDAAEGMYIITVLEDRRRKSFKVVVMK